MSRRSWSRAFGALTAGLLLVMALPLTGAASELPVDDTALASPAVVWVRASVETGVVVVEHEGEITLHISRFLLPMRNGSGTVVNHFGTIATAASVIDTDLQRAKLYAINKAFAKTHKLRIADPFRRQHLRDPRLNAKLNACYGSSPHRVCVVTSQTRVIEVFPWAAPPYAKGLPAQALTPSGAPKGIALLQINGSSNMPTAALVPAGGLPERATILGFSGPPKADDPPGRAGVTPDRLKKLKLSSGMSGGPVVDQRGRMVGLIAAPGEDGAGKASFHSADEIASVLNAARVQAQRSVVDSTFEQAIQYYRGRHDRHAVERFDQVLSFYPKHAMATHLRKAASKGVDTAQDRSNGMDQHEGMPAAAADDDSLARFLIPAGIGLLVLTVGAVIVWRRRPGWFVRRKPTAATSASGAEEARPAADPAKSPSRPAVPPATRGGTRSLAQETPVAEPGGNSDDAGKRRRSAELTPAGYRAGGGRGQAAETSMQASPPSAGGFAFCTNCGNPSRPGHRFCGYCGNRFG